jgi:hypothetical protein
LRVLLVLVFSAAPVPSTVRRRRRRLTADGSKMEAALVMIGLIIGLLTWR